MKKYLLALILYFICVFYFTNTVSAYDLYFIYYTDEVDEAWDIEKVYINKNLNLEGQIYKLFTKFFNNPKNIYSPKDVQVLDVTLIDDLLLINVSREIMNHGGNFYTNALKKQIVRTALSIEQVNRVTLCIESETYLLPEGIAIENESIY